MPFGQARYGAKILSFTNANPCVITVDRVSVQLVSGDYVIIAACICDQYPQLNGKYLVTDVTGNDVTIDLDSTSYGSYVSGGYVTILELDNASPPPQFNPYVVYNLSQTPLFVRNE